MSIFIVRSKETRKFLHKSFKTFSSYGYSERYHNLRKQGLTAIEIRYSAETVIDAAMFPSMAAVKICIGKDVKIQAKQPKKGAYQRGVYGTVGGEWWKYIKVIPDDVEIYRIDQPCVGGKVQMEKVAI